MTDPIPGYLTGARPAWDVPMPEGVERRPLEWYCARARARQDALDEAALIITQAARTAPQDG
ncbi:hypothetical protein AB0B28_08040 [Glycomyces sp. NPDC046736]|uniref:hypothetical protein n=1 Tax=Glycomyces sp. NPDC046736 TaxID=3155615 RepID=UPI0033D73396